MTVRHWWEREFRRSDGQTMVVRAMVTKDTRTDPDVSRKLTRYGGEQWERFGGRDQGENAVRSRLKAKAVQLRAGFTLEPR